MSNDNWIGKSIGGRYKIEERLGQGGMSSVYKATDPNLRRVVAVKLIHPHLSNEENFVRRFEEEAAAVAQLRHPHIIQVFDFDHDNDVYYMVLEFVPGETLQERLKRLNEAGRRLPLDEAIKYAIEICESVDYAHNRSLIHRDLKPANVMLNVQSEAILMDFGIAKIVGGQHHTATGAVIGTARYMSPEQIRGVEIDRRSDIYSLGVMLFEMVSGRPPFESDSAMTLMMMHVNDPVPDLHQLRPEVPEALIRVIEKALTKDRKQRFQTAAEMAAALRTVQKQMNTASPEGTWLEPQPKEQFAGGTYLEPQANRPDATYAVPAQESARQIPIPQSQPRKKKISPVVIAGGLIGILSLVCIIAAGIIFIPKLLSGNTGGEEALQPTSPTASVAAEDQIATLIAETSDANVEPVAVVVDEDTPTPTLEPTATQTPQPSPTETPSITPSPTYPTDLYVTITDITIDGNYYVVQYETYGFTEVLPGTHVHFFFDTVPVEQAGSPGSGPWKLYGGPRPFKEYSVSARPAGATQMCARVANSDHSLYDTESGNCYDLPDS